MCVAFSLFFEGGLVEKAMEEKEERMNGNVSADLEKILNIHGFGFQYSVIKTARDLYDQQKCGWLLEASEIPVGNPGEQTHIDFVFELTAKSWDENRKAYLIGECKRVDPAKANWLFVKNPRKIMYGTRIDSLIQIESIIPNLGSAVNPARAMTRTTHVQRGTFELGFESKTDAKGDGIGSHDRSPINQALGQVFRAQKGFIGYLDRLRHDLRNDKLRKEAVFVPAIFTTAKLYTSNTQLDLADTATGKLPSGSVEAVQVPWLWYNHNRFLDASPFIRDADKDRDSYFGDFTRSVAIVSSSGLEEFMKIDFLELLRW